MNNGRGTRRSVPGWARWRSLYLLLLIAGANDVFAIAFNLPFEWLVWIERVGVFVLPPIAYVLTHRICLGLQQDDRDVLQRGIRTGLLQELPDGVFAELRQPPGGVDDQGRPLPLFYGGARIDRTIAVPGTEEGGERHV